MRGYSHLSFRRFEIRYWHRAVNLVESLSDNPKVRSQELARAIGVALGLRVVDGKYDGTAHSWIKISDNKSSSILDVCVPRSLPMVQLISQHDPRAKKYIVRSNCSDVDQPTLEKLFTELKI